MSQSLSPPNSSHSTRRHVSGQGWDHSSVLLLTGAFEEDCSMVGLFFLWHFPGVFSDKFWTLQPNLTLLQALRQPRRPWGKYIVFAYVIIPIDFHSWTYFFLSKKGDCKI